MYIIGALLTGVASDAGTPVSPRGRENSWPAVAPNCRFPGNDQTAEALGYAPSTIERHAVDSATAYTRYIAAIRDT